jgi:AcrR family transcriptional regulator
MSEKKEKPTEEVILEAAMKVFTRRGFAAARTEEIAKEAGINRALLHYYYRDKETIFNLIALRSSLVASSRSLNQRSRCFKKSKN